LKRKDKSFNNAPIINKTDQRSLIAENQNQLREYKNMLESLNTKANEMFEHVKSINKLVSKKIMDIEGEVTKSESIFVDEINKLLNNKLKIADFQKKC
jgi:hypothetical protein